MLSKINFKKNGHGNMGTKYSKIDNSGSQVYDLAKKLENLENLRNNQIKSNMFGRPLQYDKL